MDEATRRVEGFEGGGATGFEVQVDSRLVGGGVGREGKSGAGQVFDVGIQTAMLAYFRPRDQHLRRSQ